MDEFALKPIPKAKYNRGGKNFMKNMHKALQKKVKVKKLNVKQKLEKFLKREEKRKELIEKRTKKYEEVFGKK
jgi:hypothetical protein|tara:strand:+ start:2591 stop:2809 length:219 start_codon:yes stop_codon:yes gene_type:complete